MNQSNAQDFDRAFRIIVNVEKGLSKDPKDAGNWTGGKPGSGQLKGTKYGISAATYPNEDIENLTLDRAKALYRRDFWDAAQCGLLAWPLNLAVFDGAVQHDPNDARRLLQRAIGAAVDGRLGPRSLAAVAAVGDAAEAAALYMRQRIAYYRSLRGWADYGDGWTNRLFRVAFAS